MIHPPCTGYNIIFSDEAKKNLRKLEVRISSKILEKIKDLVTVNYGYLNIKKLKSGSSLYRLRVGDYRVVYRIEREKIIVYIVTIGHRRDVYDGLNRRL